MSRKRQVVVGLLVLLVACGGNGASPQPAPTATSATSTPSAISADPYYVAAKERIGLYARCLQEKGFDVKQDQDLATSENIPEEQREAFERAADVCWDEAIARYPQAPPPTEDEMWELYLESAACLEAEGYTVSEPPTEEAWKDAFPQRVIWYPWETVPYVSEEQWIRLNRVCVQPGTR